MNDYALPASSDIRKLNEVHQTLAPLLPNMALDAHEVVHITTPILQLLLTLQQSSDYFEIKNPSPTFLSICELLDSTQLLTRKEASQ